MQKDLKAPVGSNDRNGCRKLRSVELLPSNGNGHFWKCVLSVRISGASGTAFKLIQLIVRLTVSSLVITLMVFQKKLLTISGASGTAFKLIQHIVRLTVSS